MIPTSLNVRAWLAVGALCAATACGDARAPGVTGTDNEQNVLFAMASEAVEEASRLYAIADTAAGLQQWNRAMLLWAAIDGLQYGSPMHELTITVDGVPLTFTAIFQESVVTEQGVHHSTAHSLIAWSGANAQRILVIYDQIDGVGGDAALYLDGGNTLFLSTSGAQSVERSALGASCAYEQRTPLVGPPGVCTNSTMSAAVSVTMFADGDPNAASRSVSVTTAPLAGISVSRALEDF